MTLPAPDRSSNRRSLHRVCSLIAAAAVLIAGAGCAGSATEEDRGGPCPTGSVFGTPILPFDELDHIVPLGSINPSTGQGGHTLPTSHTYWNTREPGLRPVPLYAPGDLQILRIYRAEFSSPRHNDYEIVFAVCDDVEGNFAHVSNVTPSLAALLSNPLRCETTDYGSFTRTDCEFSVERAVRQGEMLGTVSELAFQRGVDFGLRDSRHALAFANPTRWLEWITHTVCPVDYYEPSIRTRLEGLFGANGIRRTTSPLCGRIDFDLPGTARGVWFRSGGSTDDQGLVVLMTDNVMPAIPAFSIGAIGSLNDGQALYFGSGSTGRVRRTFDQVTADDAIWCYDELNRAPTLTTANEIRGLVILVQLRSDGRLQFESRTAPECGSGPWAFSSAALTLER